MALEKTQAIVLKSYDWAESSRTISLFSRQFGRVSLIDKGGRRLTSRRGRVIPFANLEITFYASKKETSGYISDIELLHLYEMSGEGSLGRLAYASAACELLRLLLPSEEPQEELFDYFNSWLEMIDKCDKRSLPALFLAFLLRLLSQLGYHPSLGYCVSCSREASTFLKDLTNAPFSPERGGLICPSCQMPVEYYIALPEAAFTRLLKLQTASLKEAREQVINFSEASILLEALIKFLEYQADMTTRINSLEFLEKLKRTHLSAE